MEFCIPYVVISRRAQIYDDDDDDYTCARFCVLQIQYTNSDELHHIYRLRLNVRLGDNVQCTNAVRILLKNIHKSQNNLLVGA